MTGAMHVHATSVTRRARVVVLLAGVALFGLQAVAGAIEASRPAMRPVVFVARLEGVIDLGLAPFVERALDEAAAAGAAAVILEINTFGGRVDAAVLIRDALLRSRVRTVAFVNKRAISAGALISLAAETIVMADGGTIGAATPVGMGAPGRRRSPWRRRLSRTCARSSAPPRRAASGRP